MINEQLSAISTDFPRLDDVHCGIYPIYHLFFYVYKFPTYNFISIVFFLNLLPRSQFLLLLNPI